MGYIKVKEYFGSSAFSVLGKSGNSSKYIWKFPQKTDRNFIFVSQDAIKQQYI